MPFARPLSLLALASALCSCSAGDIIGAISTKEPAEAPGTSVAGATGCNQPIGARCLLWSADSKTLFVDDGQLMKAVDIATGTSRNVGIVQAPMAMVASRDGVFIYFSALTSAAGVVPQAFAIYRIPIAGTATASFVVTAASSNFVLAPDGNALAYHAAGSPYNSDTLVVRDIASGVRLGSTIAASATLLSSSPDGSSVAILLSDTPSSTCSFAYGCTNDVRQIWHPATTIRDVVTGLPATTTDLQWTEAGFRALFGGRGAGSVVAEVSVATATVTNFAVPAYPFPQAIAWAADAERVFVADDNDHCYNMYAAEGNNPCGHHYTIESLSHGASTLSGSINANDQLTAFLASPNGRWLAYQADGRTFILAGP